ncbi:3'-5' exonuclease [Beta vulgaris subsp. vulgaris]|uniref:3'-5' exonuclease n=1 Tax=Beta vulgaris subsp. vulgaris TaxID=3555 RepID=UPI00053F6467|nr:3'-5' exonuclease [Beta vulgaris subsp. vulgaris]
MSMSYEVRINGGVLVTTTVINTVAELDAHLTNFISVIHQNADISECVVGLDIEKDFRPHYSFARPHHNFVAEKVAILKLCYGTSCLIIQLLHLNEAPYSLSNFLQLNWISFVGVGIKHCVEALDRDYGIKCRNAIDLGELVSTNIVAGRYRVYGLLDILKMFQCRNLELKKTFLSHCKAVAQSNWGVTTLSVEQIEAATFEAFLCFEVGNHILESRSRPGHWIRI